MGLKISTIIQESATFYILADYIFKEWITNLALEGIVNDQIYFLKLLIRDSKVMSEYAGIGRQVVLKQP